MGPSGEGMTSSWPLIIITQVERTRQVMGNDPHARENPANGIFAGGGDSEPSVRRCPSVQVGLSLKP